MERRFASPPVRFDLRRIGMPSLAALLSHHRQSQRGAESLVGPGPVNTVTRERLQWSGPRALFAGVDSFFFEEHDPFLRPGAEARTFLDRYLQERAAAGAPVAGAELDAVTAYVNLGDFGPDLARAIAARAAAAAAHQ
jgi:hypothetical protein